MNVLHSDALVFFGATGDLAFKKIFPARLRAAGHEVIDFGARELNPDDDYPDFVIPLGQAVVSGKVDRGVAVCGQRRRRVSLFEQDQRRSRLLDRGPFFCPARGGGR